MDPARLGRRYVLRNVGIPAAALGQAGGVGRHDILVADGRIESVGPATRGDNDLDGGLVLPCFVDIHTHLDKGHIWPRKAQSRRHLAWRADGGDGGPHRPLGRRGCRPADGFLAALRFRPWHRGDPHASRHRTPPQHEISFDVFEAMRDRWAGRIELQAVSIVGPETLVDPLALKAVATRVQAAGGLLGGSVAVFDRSREAMRAVVETAGNLGLDLDLHTDETGDPAAHALLHLAEAVLETGFTGKVDGRPLLRAERAGPRHPAPHHRQGRRGRHRRGLACRCATSTCRTASRAPRARRSAAA